MGKKSVARNKWISESIQNIACDWQTIWGQQRSVKTQDAITYPSLRALSLLTMFAQAVLGEMRWKMASVYVGGVCVSV